MSALFGRYMCVTSSSQTKKWEMGGGDGGGWHRNIHDTYEFTHVSQPTGVSTSMLLFVLNVENHMEPDLVRRNPPQSDQTAESFLLTG